MNIEKLRSRFYDKSQIDWDHMMFSDHDLWKLMIPLIIEQFLATFMGMMDSIMVSRVGSAAISAVSLSDSINTLIIQIFAALATGGTIICSQYIGMGDKKKGNIAARQVVISVVFIGAAILAISELFCNQILGVIFGSVEPAVMTASINYFKITALSFPFLGLAQVGSAFYRAGGNSKFPMIVNVGANVLNIIGNAVFIFVFKWGVEGAALSTLISRALTALIIFGALRIPKQPIVISDYLHMHVDLSIIKKVLFIGIPSGIENGMFQFGKLAIQSSVSTLGTDAIAAQAMTALFENFNGMGGVAIGIGLMTVVGQTMGAGRKEEAKYYISKFLIISEWAILVGCLFTFAFGKPIMVMTGLKEESVAMTMQMLIFITILKPILWIFSFTASYGMRAAGDVKYSMITASMSMWVCRVVVSTVLIRVFGFGPIAVWIGMASDWAVRGFFFMRRYLSMKWIHEVV